VVLFPIHLYYLEEIDANLRVKRIQTLKQTIEKSLGKDNVVIDIQKQPRDKVMVATFLGTTPETMDWDIWINGFNPDFLDPSSYLRIFDPRNGAYLHSLGLHPTDNKSMSSNEKQIIQEVELDKYSELLEQANKITQKDNLSKRFAAFADAEAHLLNQRIVIPMRTDVFSLMLRIKPFSYSYGLTGVMRSTSWQSPRFKYMELQKEMVTKKQYQKAKQEFETKLKEAAILDEKK
jgi:oligopeptide transport system substrate-binding protein